jgi:hypothetical protein
MNNATLFLIGCFAFVLGCYVIGGRYEITPASDPTLAWRLDRLTGEVSVCTLATDQVSLTTRDGLLGALDQSFCKAAIIFR